jgi:hypothetical protein
MKGRNLEVNLTVFHIPNISARHSMVKNGLADAVSCGLHKGTVCPAIVTNAAPCTFSH